MTYLHLQTKSDMCITNDVIDVTNGLAVKPSDENKMVVKPRRLDLDDEYDDPLEVNLTGQGDLKASGDPHSICNFKPIYLISESVEPGSTNKGISLALNFPSGVEPGSFS